MIINYSDTCFSVKFQSEDWYCASTYTLNDFIKSIPKGYRRFDWNTKEWIINNKYKYLLKTIHCYTDEEEQLANLEMEQFFALIDAKNDTLQN